MTRDPGDPSAPRVVTGKLDGEPVLVVLDVSADGPWILRATTEGFAWLSVTHTKEADDE